MLLPWLRTAEWLEADGLGGFAMGTASGVRTRRYHGLLLTALTPPTGRVMLVSGFDAEVETPVGRFAISSQCYSGEMRHPDGESRLMSFDSVPWPIWQYQLEDGTRIDQELFVTKGTSAVCLRWTATAASGHDLRDVRLIVRPFLAVRNYHCLQHENRDFQFDADIARFAQDARNNPFVVPPSGGVLRADCLDADRLNAELRTISCSSPRLAPEEQPDEMRIAWRPYADAPAIVSWSNGDYRHAPDWYRQFLYSCEAARGLDCLEDLAMPGELSWDLSRGEAVWLLMPETSETTVRPTLDLPLVDVVQSLRQREAERRRPFASWLHRAADSYIVNRGSGQTIIAGYPWFTDWGRDTFIALRGLCLTTGRLDVAESILTRWAGEVSEGMLPNRFPDQGESPEFNSVDASLWFVIAVHEFLAASPNSNSVRATLRHAVGEILNGHSRGTRFGIRLDDDGLLAAGEPGVQLTWMDAKVGDWVVTPRIGKPVEIQALWLNALWLELRLALQTGDKGTISLWQEPFERGLNSFRKKFWNEAAGCLFDIVDAEHRCGQVDVAIRPNQIFAAGGLPLTLLEPDRARQVVDVVEARLWTPLGLRTLAPSSPNYAGRYGGSPRQRDAAYHQGTAWPWLLGAFVDAWIKTRSTDDGVSSESVRREAFQNFVEPLLAHRYQAGLNHISEIADGNPPYQPDGCPFQAWSVGELLRAAALCQSEAALKLRVTSRRTASFMSCP